LEKLAIAGIAGEQLPEIADAEDAFRELVHCDLAAHVMRSLRRRGQLETDALEGHGAVVVDAP
jgi:hypothetical protein